MTVKEGYRQIAVRRMTTPTKRMLTKTYFRVKASKTAFDSAGILAVGCAVYYNDINICIKGGT